MVREGCNTYLFTLPISLYKRLKLRGYDRGEVSKNVEKAITMWLQTEESANK